MKTPYIYLVRIEADTYAEACAIIENKNVEIATREVSTIIPALHKFRNHLEDHGEYPTPQGYFTHAFPLNADEINSLVQELEHNLGDYNKTPNQRLKYLRGEIEAERISYGEIVELQSLTPHIDPSDTQLLEWAGVPEGEPIVVIPAIPTTDNQKHQAYLDYRNDFLTVTRFAEHYGWTEELATEIIDEGRIIHNLRAAEGELNIIDRLKIQRPEIAIVVKWEEDHDYEWDGDGKDPIEDCYYPYNVCVTAFRIYNGEIIQGKAYLGGCYSQDAGKDDPTISGYLDQLVEEAVSELDKQK